MIGLTAFGAHVAVALQVLVHDPSARTEVDAARAAPLCAGVRATLVVAAGDPDLSIAVLARDGAARGVVRRRGARFDDYRIAFIGRDRVWLSSRDSLCQAPIWHFASEAAPTTKAQAAKDEPSKALQVTPGYTPLPPALAKGIKRLSATEYVIDGATRDQVIEAQAALFRGVKVAPEMKDGRNLGYRLFGIRPGTALAAIGLLDDDRITTLNGFDLTDPQTALEAYARLRTTSRLTLTVVRGGKPVNLDYEIR